MTKKKKRQSLTPEERLQRKMIKALVEEATELHELSLLLMAEEAILPPFYAGEYLGEDREIIPLWGVADEEPELAALLIRVVPGVEPNFELNEMREDLGLENDWPVSELLAMMEQPDGKPAVEGQDRLKDLEMLLVLDGDQVQAAPGYDRDEMLIFIGEKLPYAVFVKVPTAGEGDTLTYQWDDVEHYHAEVIYADSPQLLEAAVWEYRVDRALHAEVGEILKENGSPEEELLATTTANLAAVFDTSVMHAFRLYGTTSAIRSRQQALDILREENGDLIVKAPLKPEVEPIPEAAQFRSEITGDAQGLILHMPAEGEVLQKVWPTIRAHSFFTIKVRHGVYVTTPDGGLRVKGYSDNGVMEWTVAEALPQLYRIARLGSIYEMLAACELIDGKIQSG